MGFSLCRNTPLQHQRGARTVKQRQRAGFSFWFPLFCGVGRSHLKVSHLRPHNAIECRRMSLGATPPRMRASVPLASATVTRAGGERIIHDAASPLGWAASGALSLIAPPPPPPPPERGGGGGGFLTMRPIATLPESRRRCVSREGAEAPLCACGEVVSPPTRLRRAPSGCANGGCGAGCPGVSHPRTAAVARSGVPLGQGESVSGENAQMTSFGQ